MAYKTAHFKTAYLQREVVMDVKVATELKVGALCSYAAATGSTPATITGVETVAAAHYIVAQSDMTLEYGHVPVENRNYAYSNVVAASTAPKRVALFKIIDPDDVELD